MVKKEENKINQSRNKDVKIHTKQTKIGYKKDLKLINLLEMRQISKKFAIVAFCAKWSKIAKKQIKKKTFYIYEHDTNLTKKVLK